jgi:pyridoxal phosphate enzyme (YggS family)
VASDISLVDANLGDVRGRIARAAARAGRRAEDVTLIAVSKTHPAEVIRAAFDAGVRHFGENRVQEWESKRGALSDLDATWHLIGHLQSNKARRAGQIFHCVDSIDDLALAAKLDGIVADPANATLSKKLPVLIEVQLAAEESKSGVREGDLAALIEAFAKLAQLELRGLMAIPPFLEDAEAVRPYFRKLREIRDGMRRQFARGDEFLPELSMGMSHDFEVAIEEGATQVRVGTALFGARPKA